MAITTGDSACGEGHKQVAIIPLGSEYGSADYDKLAELERRLLGAIDGSPARLLIDLSRTKYIGCGFLSILLRCRARVRESDCRLALCTVTSLPESVLSLTRLDVASEIYGTRQDAIEAMQPPLDNE